MYVLEGTELPKGSSVFTKSSKASSPVQRCMLLVVRRHSLHLAKAELPTGMKSLGCGFHRTHQSKSSIPNLHMLTCHQLRWKDASVLC